MHRLRIPNNKTCHTIVLKKNQMPYVYCKDQNTIVAFECKVDAIRYATLVEAGDDVISGYSGLDVQEFDKPLVEKFCKENNYNICFYPEGFLALPPYMQLTHLTRK